MAKILLIDDDGDLLAMISAILKNAGHEVLEAKNGKDGLRIFRKARPELVITDIVMPEDEGIEMITSLRRDYPDCRIIAISGASPLSEKLYLPIALKLGAARALSKPFNGEQLLSAVKAVLA